MAAPKEAAVRVFARHIAGLGTETMRARLGRLAGTELLLRRAMADQGARTQLFRFVDALPSLGDTADLTRHLEEYFGGLGAPASLAGMAAAVRLSRRVPFAEVLAARVARHEVAQMARQFIVATEPLEAALELGKLWSGGSAATIDLLGEHTHSELEADRYGERVAGLVATLSEQSAAWPADERLERDDLGPLGRVAVSIKATALAPDFSPLTSASALAGASRRLRPVLSQAVARGAQVWFDLEHYEVRSLTRRLFEGLVAEPSLAGLRAGIVVQAYLKDSYAELARICEWATTLDHPIGVRLVKGAYFDAETTVAQAAGWPVPVYANKAETDANFERCSRLLHAYHGSVRAAFGSHNLRSLAYAIEAGRAAGIPDNGYEIQLLYGMAEPVHEAFRRLGFRLRVYAPMGELVPGMAYLVRRLLENTANESFVRLRFAEKRDLRSLLGRPAADLPPDPPPELAEALVRPAPTRAPVGAYRPEPLVRWFAPRASQEMAGSISRVRDGLGREIPAQIGGRAVHTAEQLVSVDPAEPSRVVATTASCGVAEADRAVAACAEAFRDWAAAGCERRAAVVFEAAQYLREHRLDTAALEVFEVGKCWDDADADVCEAIDFLEYYGREALRLGGGGTVSSPPGETNRLTYEPRGVAAVIAPWNLPLAIATGMTAAALVAGNCVVLKPAEQSPAVARVLVDALFAGGLPQGALALLPGRGEVVGAHLVTHRDVSLVAFTGSLAVGLQINEMAARTTAGQREVRRVIAEMGGKNPLVVDADADLDEAVPIAIRSAFGFAGQRCSAASRIVCVGGVHDAFVERFVEAARALRIGHPADQGVELGPVIDAEARDRVLSWREKARGAGEVLLEGDDVPDSGYFVGPIIVDDAPEGSGIVTEEIFGPIVAVQRARDFDDAIRLANQSDFALTAGLVSRSPSHIERASAALRAGNVYVNRAITGAVVGCQPFGGHGMSGVGSKTGGPDYLAQFSVPRVVTENTIRQGFTPEAR